MKRKIRFEMLNDFEINVEWEEKVKNVDWLILKFVC
jgi:hypothetical protein